ncbi:hypothetical protein VTI28DRAFT_6069 [Corynascus sepedonium]
MTDSITTLVLPVSPHRRGTASLERSDVDEPPPERTVVARAAHSFRARPSNGSRATQSRHASTLRRATAASTSNHSMWRTWQLGQGTVSRRRAPSSSRCTSPSTSR